MTRHELKEYLREMQSHGHAGTPEPTRRLTLAEHLAGATSEVDWGDRFHAWLGAVVQGEPLLTRPTTAVEDPATKNTRVLAETRTVLPSGLHKRLAEACGVAPITEVPEGLHEKFATALGHRGQRERDA
jgi:hypothetical protein